MSVMSVIFYLLLLASRSFLYPSAQMRKKKGEKKEDRKSLTSLTRLTGCRYQVLSLSSWSRICLTAAVMLGPARARCQAAPSKEERCGPVQQPMHFDFAARAVS